MESGRIGAVGGGIGEGITMLKRRGSMFLSSDGMLEWQSNIDELFFIAENITI